MPQITVTISDDVYWDLMTLPKGLKSKYVNEALGWAVNKCRSDNGLGDVCPARMHAYARGRLAAYVASIHDDQEKLPVESANEKWMREQKEALE
jgi:hypothetical protein